MSLTVKNKRGFIAPLNRQFLSGNRGLYHFRLTVLIKIITDYLIPDFIGSDLRRGRNFGCISVLIRRILSVSKPVNIDSVNRFLCRLNKLLLFSGIGKTAYGTNLSFGLSVNQRCQCKRGEQSRFIDGFDFMGNFFFFGNQLNNCLSIGNFHRITVKNYRCKMVIRYRKLNGLNLYGTVIADSDAVSVLIRSHAVKNRLILINLNRFNRNGIGIHAAVFILKPYFLKGIRIFQRFVKGIGIFHIIRNQIALMRNQINIADIIVILPFRSA